MHRKVNVHEMDTYSSSTPKESHFENAELKFRNHITE
jgi:hypothetical protein